MGYESRVYLVEVHRRPRYTYAERIAEVRMCKMNDENWLNLFTKPIDYKLYMDDGNTEFDTDDYGDHLMACPIADVIAYLEEKMKVDSYRRLPLLYGLLAGINPEKWEHLEVVHFGY